jgi:hypothetical protein
MNKPKRHRWREEEWDELTDICLAFPPGSADRAEASERLVARINSNPVNPLTPSAIGRALRATDNAIADKYQQYPRTSQGHARLIENRRRAGKLKKKWKQ